MARADALSSGTGTLAILTFQVNPGAEEGLTSDLAIAGFELSDETGVITLTAKVRLKHKTGKSISAGPTQSTTMEMVSWIAGKNNTA